MMRVAAHAEEQDTHFPPLFRDVVDGRDTGPVVAQVLETFDLVDGDDEVVTLGVGNWVSRTGWLTCSTGFGDRAAADLPAAVDFALRSFGLWSLLAYTVTEREAVAAAALPGIVPLCDLTSAGLVGVQIFDLRKVG